MYFVIKTVKLAVSLYLIVVMMYCSLMSMTCYRDEQRTNDLKVTLFEVFELF